jgi:small subunit ribosomal protein S17
MARKKKEEETEGTEPVAQDAENAEQALTAAPAESSEAEGESGATEAVEAADADSEKKPKKASAKQAANAEPSEETSIVDDVVDLAASVIETAAEVVGKGAADLISAIAGPPSGKKSPQHKRAEKIGIVSSDKMTKTVVVRVDRLLKHPVYRKYVKRRKKFMAHDELGARIGDKVKIVETRPLSARKRWRVVEIIHRAEL